MRSKHWRTACTGLPMIRSVAQLARSASYCSTSSCRRSVITLGGDAVVVVVLRRRRQRGERVADELGPPAPRRRASSRSSRGRGRRCPRRWRCTGRARRAASHVAIGDVVRLPTRFLLGCGRYGGGVWLISSFSRCAICAGCTRPTRKCCAASTSRCTPAPRSACSASTAPGKSTLLRIIAGEDDGYQGECRVTPGFSVGFLPQEPRLDADEGRARQRHRRRRATRRTCSTASKRSATRWASPTPTSTSSSPSRRSCRTRSTPSTAGTSTASSRSRWTRCACPPADADVTTLSRW